MPIESERRRVLVAAGSSANGAFHKLFSISPLDRWETVQADSFSRARFLLQHGPCDLLLVNDDLYEREGGQGLAWLAWRRETPVVFLAGSSAVHFQRAYELGAYVCLPRQLVLEHPPLLATAMEQAIKNASTKLDCRRAKERLAESRQHVDRLVSMIWRTTSRQADAPWFSQRQMLARLGEELARAERHQVPLSLALGEVQPAEDDGADDQLTMPDWTTEVIAKGKRRCDVAGQYGLGGFMLLMVHTPIKGGVQCCRRLQRAIEHPHEPLGGPHAGVHAFFGVSSTAGGRLSAAALLRSAEQNLDAARRESMERLVVD